MSVVYPPWLPSISQGGTAPDLNGIQAAIQQAVVAASGLQDGQVVFRDQNARAPNTPSDPENAYITIHIDGPFNVGGPKGQIYSEDDTQPAGQEMAVTTTGPGELAISLQAYTKDTVGNSSAQWLLEQVQMSFQTQATKDGLIAAGVSCFDVGRVQRVPRVYAAAMEGRAVLDLRAYIVQSVTTRTGYANKATPIGGTLGTFGTE